MKPAASKIDAKSISELQNSKIVQQKRDEIAMEAAPTSFYSFERNFKALKSDPAML